MPNNEGWMEILFVGNRKDKSIGYDIIGNSFIPCINTILLLSKTNA